MEKLYKIGGSKKHCRGTFAAQDIKKGQIIFYFDGDLYDVKNKPFLVGSGSPYTGENDRYARVSENLFLGPFRDDREGNLNGPDDLTNHSCNPNCLITSDRDLELKIKARRDIKEGEELTYDYSTVVIFDSWEMECHCGEKNCRKIIGEFRTLPVELQKQYIKEGGVPKYFLKHIKFDDENNKS